jgi:hypothetical protein
MPKAAALLPPVFLGVLCGGRTLAGNPDAGHRRPPFDFAQGRLSRKDERGAQIKPETQFETGR